MFMIAWFQTIVINIYIIINNNDKHLIKDVIQFMLFKNMTICQNTNKE